MNCLEMICRLIEETIGCGEVVLCRCYCFTSAFGLVTILPLSTQLSITKCLPIRATLQCAWTQWILLLIQFFTPHSVHAGIGITFVSPVGCAWFNKQSGAWCLSSFDMLWGAVVDSVTALISTMVHRLHVDQKNNEGRKKEGKFKKNKEKKYIIKERKNEPPKKWSPSILIMQNPSSDFPV